MAMTFPKPGVPYGERLLLNVIHEKATVNPNSPWVSMPIDETDLSKGFKEISFSKLNNAANHAAVWLGANIPPRDDGLPIFAFFGPKDLRYPIMAVGALKAGMEMVVPSPYATIEAQVHVLKCKNCNVYVRDGSMTDLIQSVTQRLENRRTIEAPCLEQLMSESIAPEIPYTKSWSEGKDDPWLTFHTSGTTGLPKPVTYTNQMMTTLDMFTSMCENDERTNAHYFAHSRLHTPLPTIHFVGMTLILQAPTFLDATFVVGPSRLSSPQDTIDVLQYGKVDGALLVPSVIESICKTSRGVETLCKLGYIHYAGSSLSQDIGDMLCKHTSIVPAIGSTEFGGYCLLIRPEKEDWEWTQLHPKHGGVFEKRSNNLHELVFVRDFKLARFQQPFKIYPHLDRFQTDDLWIEHPTRKGLWKIAGRTDDYIFFTHAEGLHAASLETEIEKHPLVRRALIGGYGKAKPILLVELENQEPSREDIIESLRPFIEMANKHCHERLRLSTDLLIIARADKPFVTTIKGTVNRYSSLERYSVEIAAAYEGVFENDF